MRKVILPGCLASSFKTEKRAALWRAAFPDGSSVLMLVCARLCHMAGTQCGSKKYMNIKHLEATLEDASIAG